MFSNGKRISKSILTVIAGLGLSTPAAFAQTGRVVIVQRNFMEEGPVDRSARELFNAGQKFYDQSRYPDAERTFREVVLKYPKSAIADRAAYYLIRTLPQIGKRTEALEQINAFPKTYPKSAWNADVQEFKIQLTNQVPPRAEAILLRQAPPRPPAPAAVARTIEFVPSNIPSPPSPPATRPSFFVGSQNADPQISWQQEVMRAFFRSDADRALQIAMERLKADMADPVVLSTLDAVAQSTSTQALPFLLDVAKNSPNIRARKDAIFWMSQSRGNKDALVDTLTGLLPTMTDNDADSVTFALGQVHTEKALNALAGIARDKNRSEKMRSSALLWIGQSGVPNRVPLLDDIYKNGGDSLQIRTQILFALSQTHDPQAVSILGNIAATDPDFTLRRQAVMWLGQIKSPEATQALENLLRKK
jgi:tetratricopeptide (TPR) repeat protein